MFINFQAIAVG